MLRVETTCIENEVLYSKHEEQTLIGIASDTFETKYVGEMNIWRYNSIGQLDLIESIGLDTGGVCLEETSHYQSSFIITGHTDPILRLWTRNDLKKPIKRYLHHNMSIEDLNTSPFQANEFLSCSKDSSIALWNIEQSEPIFSYNHESSFPILGINYHPHHFNLFLSCPLDGRIQIFNKDQQDIIYTIIPPDDMIFSNLSINNYNEYLFTISDEQGMIYTWDFRLLKKPIDMKQCHSLAISSLKFNPHDEYLLGSTSTDGYFNIYHYYGLEKLNHTTTILNEEEENTTRNNELMMNTIQSIQSHELPITNFDWSVHEIGLVVDASSDYSLCLWNIMNNSEINSGEEEENKELIVEE
ncbi:hypothetical protein ABK040_015752 [Willaertia magna]